MDKKNIVKGNSSSSDHRKLAYDDDVPTIAKTQLSSINEFNNLMLKISQHPNIGNINVNREWIATKFGVKVNDLNKALDINSPVGACNGLLNNSIRYLKQFEKSLDKKK